MPTWSYKRPNRKNSLALVLDDVLTLLKDLASSPRGRASQGLPAGFEVGMLLKTQLGKRKRAGRNFRTLDLHSRRQGEWSRAFAQVPEEEPDKRRALRYQHLALTTLSSGDFLPSEAAR